MEEEGGWYCCPEFGDGQCGIASSFFFFHYMFILWRNTGFKSILSRVSSTITWPVLLSTNWDFILTLVLGSILIFVFGLINICLYSLPASLNYKCFLPVRNVFLMSTLLLDSLKIVVSKENTLFSTFIYLNNFPLNNLTCPFKAIVGWNSFIKTLIISYSKNDVCCLLSEFKNLF